MVLIVVLVLTCLLILTLLHTLLITHSALSTLHSPPTPPPRVLGEGGAPDRVGRKIFATNGCSLTHLLLSCGQLRAVCLCERWGWGAVVRCIVVTARICSIILHRNAKLAFLFFRVPVFLYKICVRLCSILL